MLRLIIRVVGDFISVNGVRHITEDYPGVYVFIPIARLLTALVQYFLLRRYLPRMGGWMPATAGGWLLGVTLIAILNRLGWTVLVQDINLMFPIMGFAIGLAQWFVLRPRLARAGWWVIANTLGWGTLALFTTGNAVEQSGLMLIGVLPATVTAAGLAGLMGEVTALTEA